MNLRGLHAARGAGRLGWSQRRPAPRLKLPNGELEKDVRGTPAALVAMGARFGGVTRFDLDVAANAEFHVAPRYYTVDDNGLRQRWSGRAVWCNPPFTSPGAWTEKAWEEARRRSFDVLVMLLPAMRQEQPWWQRTVERWRDGRGAHPSGYHLRTYHPPGRHAFYAPGHRLLSSAGFPLVFLAWSRAR